MLLCMRAVFQIYALTLIIFSCSTGTNSSDNRKHKHIKLLWMNDKADWITSSLFIKDSLIYFGSFNDTFYAANLSDGKIRLKFATDYDPYFQPIIDDGNIFFTSFDLNIYSIDHSGNLLWKVNTVDRIKSNLVEDGNSIIASIRSDGIRKIEKSTGRTMWHLKQSPQSFSTSQLVLFKEKIYVGQYDWKVIAINKNTGNIEWQNDYSEFASSGPAISNKGVAVCIDKYYKGGFVKMLDFNSGHELWSTPLNCEALYKPYTDSSNVIVSTYDNKIVCLDNGTGKIKWTLALEPEETAQCNLTAFKENIFFSTSKLNLYSVNIATGNVNFKEDLSYGTGEPILANSRLYIPTGGGELWILEE